MERLTTCPKVIFIDWYGTLSSSNFWWPQEDANHPEHYIGQAVNKYLFGEMRDLLSPWMRGEFTTEDIISKLADKTGISENILLHTLAESCRTMKLTSQNILPIIQDIREKGVHVVVATDNMDTFNRWTAPALQLENFFDGILNSYYLKARKTDQDDKGNNLFFTNYLKQMKVKPGESVLIDDSEDKNNSIQNMGINYIKIESHVGLEPALLKLHKDISYRHL